jgi:MerR family redox-sensitive transcriptional activator SoxR
MLEALRNRLTTCIGCGCLSIDRCTLLNPDDEAAARGPGAHFLLRDSRRAARS